MFSQNIFDEGWLYFGIECYRNNIVEDALNAIVNASQNLWKPLWVTFRGEPGVDEGGV